MAILEKVDVPDQVLAKLEIAARRSQLSVSELASRVLTDAIARDEAVEAALMEEIRQGREELKHIVVTDEELLEAKRVGRA